MPVNMRPLARLLIELKVWAHVPGVLDCPSHFLTNLVDFLERADPKFVGCVIRLAMVAELDQTVQDLLNEASPEERKRALTGVVFVEVDRKREVELKDYKRKVGRQTVRESRFVVRSSSDVHLPLQLKVDSDSGVLEQRCIVINTQQAHFILSQRDQVREKFVVLDDAARHTDRTLGDVIAMSNGATSPFSTVATMVVYSPTVTDGEQEMLDKRVAIQLLVPRPVCAKEVALVGSWLVPFMVRKRQSLRLCINE